MAGKYALLVGNSKFADRALARLSAPLRDVEAFGNVLANPEISGFSVTSLINEKMETVRNGVADFFAKRSEDDLLLFYYSGHGLRDERGHLYLALPGTRASAPRAISLDAAFLRDEMSASRARRQVIVLDCCHAGAVALAGGKSGTGQPNLVKTDFNPGGHGIYILAASSADESAFEVEGQSIYTRHLVDALLTGAAAPEKADITVDDLHNYVLRRVASDAPMQPKRWVDEGTEPLVIARNPDPTPQISEELIDGIYDANWLTARGATTELLELCRHDNEKLRNSAQSVLLARLDYVDSLTVRHDRLIRNGLAQLVDDFSEARNEPQPSNPGAEPEQGSSEEITESSKIENEPNELSMPETVAETETETEIESNNDIEAEGQVPADDNASFENALELKYQYSVSQSALNTQPPKNLQIIPLNTGSGALSELQDSLISGDVGPVLVVPPAGSFKIGSPTSEPERNSTEGPQQFVGVSSRFAIARYLTTVGEYREYCLATKIKLPSPHFEFSNLNPVTNVNWDDANKYCAWLSESTNANYRLPSEAEWEYVCRAGSVSAFWWGQNWDPTKANNGPTISEVGKYPANAWGVYDMLGNVFEWCADDWAEGHKSSKSQSPYVERPRNKFRVIRGGSWGLRPRSLRVAYRTKNNFNECGDQIGFRVVRELD